MSHSCDRHVNRKEKLVHPIVTARALPCEEKKKRKETKPTDKELNPDSSLYSCYCDFLLFPILCLMFFHY